MGRMRMTGLAIVGACLLALMAAAGASAAEYELHAYPELGRCVAVEGGLGGYTEKNCKEASPGNTGGEYEFVPGPGPGPKFSGEGFPEEHGTFTTTGGRTISCEEARTEGEYTGPKTETLTFTYNNCVDSATGATCQSLHPEGTEAKPIPGTIKTNPLKGELGYTSGGGTETPHVGWDIKPEVGSVWATFNCGGEPPLYLTGGTNVTLEGSLVSKVIPLSKMVEAFHQKFGVRKFKQYPEKLEGQPKDTLTGTFSTGIASVTEAVTYKAKEKVANQERMEIKGKP
jgi:hypothetical protein